MAGTNTHPIALPGIIRKTASPEMRISTTWGLQEKVWKGEKGKGANSNVAAVGAAVPVRVGDATKVRRIPHHHLNPISDPHASIMRMVAIPNEAAVIPVAAIGLLVGPVAPHKVEEVPVRLVAVVNMDLEKGGLRAKVADQVVIVNGRRASILKNVGTIVNRPWRTFQGQPFLESWNCTLRGTAFCEILPTTTVPPRPTPSSPER